MNVKAIAAIAALAALTAAGAFFAFRGDGASVRAEAMDFGAMTPTEASRDAFKIAPAMLSVIYRAFGETEEAAIYDGLADVSAGEALEQLYLERLGAMAGGGLEPDQKIHEMELLNLTSRVEDDRVRIDAKWRVLGTVGHAEHMHVRGNAYSADLVIEPVEGAWRLTGFTLKDVDREDAGGLQPQSDNPYFDMGDGAGAGAGAKDGAVTQ